MNHAGFQRSSSLTSKSVAHNPVPSFTRPKLSQKYSVDNDNDSFDSFDEN